MPARASAPRTLPVASSPTSTVPTKAPLGTASPSSSSLTGRAACNAVPVLAVGHHVVDGGPRFSGPARIDAPTLQYLRALAPLASARQRPCLLVIRVIARRWPELPQVACFETAFFRDVPAPEHACPLRVRSASAASVATATMASPSSPSSTPCPRSTSARHAGKPSSCTSVTVPACARSMAGAKLRWRRARRFGGLPGTRTRRLDPDVVSDLVAELRMDPAVSGPS